MAELHLDELVEYGTNAQQGNLLGIQPFMLPADYACEETFYAKINAYLSVAQQRGWLDPKTIVVLPEYIGIWLAAAGEKPRVYQATSVAVAMQTLILSHPLRFIAAFLSAKAKDRVKYGVFRLKAQEMARLYQRVFSRLASDYRATIVAGSILLPSPRIDGGNLAIGRGKLYNVSLVYKPDGSPYGHIIHKVYPVWDELPFVARGDLAALPVFDTPTGKLGVLICADSWYPDAYETLQAKGAELVAVPSYLAPDGIWNQPWRGYNGGAAPADVNAGDVQALTEGEAWLKYALAGRASKAGIRYGINVFLRGKLWDLGSDGHTVMVRNGTVVEAKHVSGAAVVNCWIS